MAYIIPIYASKCEVIDILNLKSRHLGIFKSTGGITHGTLIFNDKLYVFRNGGVNERHSLQPGADFETIKIQESVYIYGQVNSFSSGENVYIFYGNNNRVMKFDENKGI